MVCFLANARAAARFVFVKEKYSQYQCLLIQIETAEEKCKSISQQMRDEIKSTLHEEIGCPRGKSAKQKKQFSFAGEIEEVRLSTAGILEALSSTQ